MSPGSPNQRARIDRLRQSYGFGLVRALIPLSSDTMYLLISFRKSNPPQNRRFNILISNSKHEVDDFVGALTF